MSEPEPRCKHCGKTESEHCSFEPVIMPAGCVCNPTEWGSVVRKPCDKHVGNGKTYCETCEHGEACHTPQRNTGEST